PDGDNLFLLDAAGKPLAEFSEVESGIFEAPTPGAGVLFLQAPGGAGAAQKAPQDLAGDWAVTRRGATVCAVTLGSSPFGDGFALTLKPGCDAAPGFTRWRLDGSELLFMPASGTPWRFVEAEGGSWQRLAGGSDQFMLVRQ
ncbi:MAG: protease inhibitor Inh/omp19 family protein, partial [Pseudolabrys sp.]|nr:protease inhibitor Inh/omp19 family protein [Pseudolabrys sp.]